MALTQEQLEQLMARRSSVMLKSSANAVENNRKFLAGGLFSDVLDIISVPQYTIAGALSKDKTIGEAIRDRVTPGDLAVEALGIENPYLRFAATLAIDVVTDPLTYIGIGATTKAARTSSGVMSLARATKLKEAGKITEAGFQQLLEKGLVKKATTVGGQAALGQRALLTLELPGLGGTTLVKGEKVLGGVSQATERLKQFASKYSQKLTGHDVTQLMSKGFGVRPAQTLEKGEKALSVAGIERRATVQKGIMEQTKVSARKQRYVQQMANDVIDRTNADVRKISKANGWDHAEILQRMTKKLYDNTVTIPKELDGAFSIFRKISDDLTQGWHNAGGELLLDKQLPNVLRTETGLELAGYGASKNITKNPSDLMANYVGMRSKAGKVVGAQMQGGDAAKLITGKQLVQFEDGLYMPADVYKAIEAGQTKIPKMIEDLRNSAKRIKGNTKLSKTDIDKKLGQIDQSIKQLEEIRKFTGDLTLDNIKVSAPEVIFERVALDPEASTKVYQKLGGKGAFEENLATLLKVKSQRVSKKAASADYIDNVKRFGRKVEDEIPEGWGLSKHDELKGYMFPKEMIGHIDATYTAFQPKELAIGVRLFDKVQNLWKASATFLNPAFHTRNGVSNLWQMHLADAHDLRAYKAAGEIATLRYSAWKNNTNILDEIAKVAKTNPKMRQYEQWLTEFYTEGLGHVGAFTADMEGLAARIQKTAPFKLGGAAGEIVEDTSKMALYFDRRLKGLDVKEAAMDVRKYLFDYSDLTEFERTYLKRFMPFYTWTRKNVPLQMSMLIQRPAKFSSVAKFENAIRNSAEGEPIPEEYMPEWLAEAYPIYFGTSGEGLARYIKAEGFLPAVDLNALERLATGEMIKEQVTPLIKTPLEMILNYDVFFEREISEFEGQKKRFLGANINPYFEHVLRTVRPLQELNKILGTGDEKKIASAKKRVLNYFIGKSYDLSRSEQKQFFEYMQSMQERQVEKDIEDAKKKDDTKEVRRLKKLLKEVEQGKGIHL